MDQSDRINEFDYQFGHVIAGGCLAAKYEGARVQIDIRIGFDF